MMHDQSMTDTDGCVRLVLQKDGRCSAMSMLSLCVSHQSTGCDPRRYKQCQYTTTPPSQLPVVDPGAGPEGER